MKATVVVTARLEVELGHADPKGVSETLSSVRDNADAGLKTMLGSAGRRLSRLGRTGNAYDYTLNVEVESKMEGQ